MTKPQRETRNLLSECNNLGLSPQEFMDTFCRRCRNYTCTNAGWADSAWEYRMRTQVDRLFDERLEADPDDPRYERVREAQFPSLLREAIRLDLAEQKGDWSIPSDEEVSRTMRVRADEINFAPPADEIPDENTSTRIDDALEALTGKRPVRKEDSSPDPANFIAAPEHVETSERVVPEQGSIAVESQPEPAPKNPQPRQPHTPQQYKLPDQTGAVIGGAAPPPTDPWSVSNKPKNVVDVGATVAMKK